MTGRLGHCWSFFSFVRFGFAYSSSSVFFFYLTLCWVLNFCHLRHTFFHRCQELDMVVVPLCRKWTFKFLNCTSVNSLLLLLSLYFWINFFFFSFCFLPTKNTQTAWNARNRSINWNSYNNSSARQFIACARERCSYFCFEQHIHKHTPKSETVLWKFRRAKLCKIDKNT